MSTYEAGYQPTSGYRPSGLQPPPGPAPRPTLLTFAVAGTFLVVALTVLAHVIALATGRSVIQDELEAEVGANGTALLGLLAQAAIDEGYGVLQSRAILSIVLAVLAAVFGLLALRGSLGVRITLAVVLVTGVAINAVAIGDVFPAASMLSAGLALLLAVIVTVVLFLPAVNRYRRTRAG